MALAITAVDLGFAILTRGQAVNDYPDLPIDDEGTDKVLVLTNQLDDEPLLAVYGSNAELVDVLEELARYASDTLLPQTVVPKVGPSSTVLSGR